MQHTADRSGKGRWDPLPLPGDSYSYSRCYCRQYSHCYCRRSRGTAMATATCMAYLLTGVRRYRHCYCRCYCRWVDPTLQNLNSARLSAWSGAHVTRSLTQAPEQPHPHNRMGLVGTHMNARTAAPVRARLRTPLRPPPCAHTHAHTWKLVLVMIHKPQPTHHGRGLPISPPRRSPLPPQTPCDRGPCNLLPWSSP